MSHHLRSLFFLAAVFGAASAAAQSACKLEPAGTAEVAAARDGRTLMLRDGRELRLAAIETPASAQPALAALASGRTLTLKKLGADSDRYGRLVGFAFLPDAPASLQQTLLEAGQARVAARVGDKACADALLTTEAVARAAKRGLWADPNFAPLPADHVTEIAAQRGHFVLVEGKVLSVRQSGGTIYLNFARRWSQGFSVVIAARARRDLTAAGIEPKKLEGRDIRVRGWLEQRNGLIVEALAPEQIEFIH
jgi:endonuclease YncB( thermonuclease family)